MLSAPHDFDLDAYVSRLPPDVGQTLLKVAIVEEWVEGLLLHHLDLDEAGIEKQFGDWGPLNSFAKKIRKTHELQLIDDETEANLLVLKNVRNEFAHTRRHLDFGSKAITDLRGKEGFNQRVRRAIDTINGKLQRARYDEAMGK